ncbi:methylmalonyl-CoA epimerase [Oceanobacillus alkalisoli]|uniref:methylmalonyl-CoA epimerase n=1 Tax=Oceanobacillus alkalisoli TaxID=2925113 RepID=UPI001EF14298|nr:methylmalonyl-CoA epimerase [Oceanobacillus alkalisoli]MCF3941709.1 methylmalonyl-CoA epimerase [Oceanobacillus alkalisoli]MCG5102990.1 methylmalonyl-CoA epimerase [Oceanobacillus alkalisoli]
MRKIRILIAKPGLDGHDRGALVIAQAMRDHGMEVIYTGLRQSPVQIATAAVQEDVDVVGLSSLSGAHNTLFPKVLEELEKRNAGDIPVIGGGVIPNEDIPFLLEKGIKRIFTSGSPTEEMAIYLKQLLRPEETPIPPKQIAHLGIAVKKIEEVLPFYTNAIGLEVEAIEEVESEGVKIAFLKVGETRIELLEPLHEQSPINSFLAQRGEGVHHIAFEVEDLTSRLSKLKEKGVRLINEESKQGANNSQIAFIHPKEAHGVLVELCEHPEGSED